MSPQKSFKHVLKYETPPKKGLTHRFSEDANPAIHSLEKQLTGSRYVNTTETPLATT
jgi:hypothetical protein